MTGTNVFIGEEIFRASETTIAANSVQKYVPARPIGEVGFWHRLRCAIKVLRGEADIVEWVVLENNK